MKTTLLLATATLMVTASIAQQRNNSIIFNEETHKTAAVYNPAPLTARPHFTRGRNQSLAAARATSTGSRWYNYGDYLATTLPTGFAASYLWNDSTSVDVYMGDHATNIYKFNNMASIGYVCDPFFFLWNDEAAFPGLMKLTPTENYTVDSVFISGIYMRNNAKTAPVDTLTVAIIYGDGSVASDLHYKAIDTTGGRSWIYNQYAVDTLYYMNMKHDSANNHADTFMGGFAPIVKQFYLTNTDTSSNFQLVIPVSVNVPAGSMPAVSVSFKSGDPSFVFGDTVFSGGAVTPYKYGMFRPFITFPGTSAVPSFPINVKGDMNEGTYRDIGYDRVPNGLYRPHWFWYNATTNGAATYQYPYFAFHITCPTCGTVGVSDAAKSTRTTIAYPNPANSEVSISFDAANAVNAGVVVTNMLGQQVASQRVDNIADGKVTLNTTNLPVGMYLYTFTSNGVRSTGRFVVAH